MSIISLIISDSRKPSLLLVFFPPPLGWIDMISVDWLLLKNSMFSFGRGLNSIFNNIHVCYNINHVCVQPYYRRLFISSLVDNFFLIDFSCFFPPFHFKWTQSQQLIYNRKYKKARALKKSLFRQWQMLVKLHICLFLWHYVFFKILMSTTVYSVFSVMWTFS